MAFVFLIISTRGYAQKQPFSPGNHTRLLQEFRLQLNDSLRAGTVSRRVQLKTASDRSLFAKVNYRQSAGAGNEFLAGEIENTPGSSFFVRIKDKSVEGNIVFRKTHKAYKYSSDSSGKVYINETDINKVLCIDFDRASAAAASSAAAKTTAVAAAVTTLESNPGANGCVLLDFDGQYVSGTPWNNGNPIDAQASPMTDAEIQQAWELVSEDYRPLNINVTTSEAVFNTYPKNRRRRCIITPTNTAAPGAGGVAYVGSFNWNDDTPCWVFNDGAKYAGDAISHEVGHTLGLSHDGRTTPPEDYYAGQGNWAPIMGVGYYKNIVQWSKGEYANANNTEDDLAVMAGTAYGVGFHSDDHGNTPATAAALAVDASGNAGSTGVIERTGDIDVFSFTTTGGTAALNFNPDPLFPDLDIQATLYNSSGAVVATANPTGLSAGISVSLAAGTYYVAVTGTGAGDPLVDGYTNYGSLGAYTISGTIAGATANAAATFYKDCNYSGSYAVVLAPGNYTAQQLIAKGIPDNDISSLRVSNGYEVVLYKNDNFQGAYSGFTSDVSCLVSYGLNDSTTSVRVRSITNQLPLVSIVSPASGSVVTAPANITISANASDTDGSISKVEFFNGATKLGEADGLPYSFTWSNVAAGSYTITVTATDDRGGQSSAQVTVTVGNAGAIFYKDCNYGGYAVNLGPGSYTLSQLNANGILNDDISSLKISSGYEVILYQDNNFLGSAYLFRGDASCLVSVSTGSATVNLNDWTSSLVIRTSTATVTAVGKESQATVAQSAVSAASLVVTPNPFVNQVTIQYRNPTGNYFDVKIFNVAGREVLALQGARTGQSINLSSLGAGIYFITLYNGKEMITQKIVKY